MMNLPRQSYMEIIEKVMKMTASEYADHSGIPYGTVVASFNKRKIDAGTSHTSLLYALCFIHEAKLSNEFLAYKDSMKRRVISGVHHYKGLHLPEIKKVAIIPKD